MSRNPSLSSRPSPTTDDSQRQRRTTTKGEFPIYQIDAFTDHVFGGNPACVVPLRDEWLPDDVLLQITQENAVAETAFILLPSSSSSQQQQSSTTSSTTTSPIPLRWFTPEIEMDLCGHATLAAAHCLWQHLGYNNNNNNNTIRFDTASGILTVEVLAGGGSNDTDNTTTTTATAKNNQDVLYQMNFPSRMPQPVPMEQFPIVIYEALSHTPISVYKARDYILLYDSEEDIRNITVDRSLLDQINLDPGGVCVTAPAASAATKDDNTTTTAIDFVSRFFTPQASILEDPVTGSAHCSLIPFWAQRFQKQDFMIAQQVSTRLGTLYCQNVSEENRVLIGGKAKTYSIGVFFL